VKIYTRTGDDGSTGLLGGKRVAKDDLRVAAYGDVDELNAFVGRARAHTGATRAVDSLLGQVQRDLFALGAQLADPTARVANRRAKSGLAAVSTLRLEKAIDRAEAGLPPLTAFVLPGGSALAAELHLCRAVCRRAERAIVALHRGEPVDPRILRYVNRLSDLLFVLARQANHEADHSEERW
jgi:cob(I)alamin adenosyltransferase